MYKEVFLLVLTIALISTAGCKQDELEPPPFEFTVTVDQITAGSARINWPDATPISSGLVTYQVYMGSIEIKSYYSENSLVLFPLSPDGYYWGKVVAQNRDGELSEAGFEFRTLPESPIISSEESSCVPFRVDWSRNFGGSETDAIHDLIATSDGNYLIAGGTMSNNGNIGNTVGGYDGWIAKMDPSGVLIWSHTYGAGLDDELLDLEATTDGGFVAVGYSSTDLIIDDFETNGDKDFWIIKIDNSGNLIWEERLGGSNTDEARSIKQTTDMGFLVGGVTESTDEDVSATISGPSDFWIVKLDQFGNEEWQIAAGLEGVDELYDMTITDDGGFALAGYSELIDTDEFNDPGNWDFSIFKYDASLDLEWRELVGGTAREVATGIIQDEDGDFIVAGYAATGVVNFPSLPSNDFMVVNIDGNGQLNWEKKYGGAEDEKVSSISTKSDGGFLITGGAYSQDLACEGYGSSDYWILSFNSQGQLQQQVRLGGSQLDISSKILQDASGRIIAAGESTSNDGHVPGNSGLRDGWIIQIELL